MDRVSYRQHFELEEVYWWFAGRREIILTALDRLPGLPAEAMILDVGCGTGLNLKIFRKLGEKAFGFDFMEEALHYSQKKRVEEVGQSRRPEDAL